MRYGILSVLLLLSSRSLSYTFGSEPTEPPDPLVAALNVSLWTNLVHAREYIDQKDAKSLGQTSGNLQLLAELLKARSDDPKWQEAIEKVVMAASAVQAAAKTEDLGKCKSSLDTLEATFANSVIATPTGMPQSLTKPPALRPLMLSLDAIFADAKVSLISGGVNGAKKQLLVVAELGKLVSGSRTTPEWTALAGDFCAAAKVAANSKESDPKAVRKLFHAISERCEACHEKSRTR